jgi:hypothetical protein
MSTESMCKVARNWVDVGSFHTRLFGVVYFDIASVREFLDSPSRIQPTFKPKQWDELHRVEKKSFTVLQSHVDGRELHFKSLRLL